MKYPTQEVVRQVRKQAKETKKKVIKLRLRKKIKNQRPGYSSQKSPYSSLAKSKPGPMKRLIR